MTPQSPQSPRLVFAPHVSSDLDESAAMWSDPEVTRFIGGRVVPREEAWARLLRSVGHWQVFGYGYWVVRDRAGRFVGEVGFAEFHREIEPALDAPETGWVLARWAHGQGFASEAVRAALAWADERFARTQCVIDPGNTASIRVAEKCGFALRAHGSYRGAPVLVMERTR